MSMGKKLKELRKGAGLSQAEVAEKLGMARATYASLEVNRREPDLGEMRRIAQLYEIEMMELIAEEGDDWPGMVMESTAVYNTQKVPDTPSKNLQQQVNPVKLRDVLLYVLDKVGAKPNVGETVIYKLLYLIDARYTAETGQSITGLSYIHSRFGPSPAKSFGDLVKNMEKNGELEIVSTRFFNNTMRKYLPLVSSNLATLSAQELYHIHRVIESVGDKTAEQLLDSIHYQKPTYAQRQEVGL